MNSECFKLGHEQHEGDKSITRARSYEREVAYPSKDKIVHSGSSREACGK